MLHIMLRLCNKGASYRLSWALLQWLAPAILGRQLASAGLVAAINRPSRLELSQQAEMHMFKARSTQHQQPACKML